MFDEYFDIEIAQLKDQSIHLAIKKTKYNLILQNYAEAHPNDTYSKLKITKPAKLNRLNSFINDWLKDEELAKDVEIVFNELAPDVDENVLVKNYGIDGDFGFYTPTLSFKIIERVIEFIEFQPDKSNNVLTQLYNNINTNFIELKELIEFLLRVVNVYKILNSISSYIFDKPVDYLTQYVNKFENVDYNYRKAILLYTNIRSHHSPSEIQLNNLLRLSIKSMRIILKKSTHNG